jgi:hypothetical protein
LSFFVWGAPVRLERADSKSLDGVPRFIIGRNGEWPLSANGADPFGHGWM